MPRRCGALVTDRRAPLLCALLVAAAFAASCDQSPGQARPADTPAKPTATSGGTGSNTIRPSSTTSISLPPRPRVVRVETMGDPCGLLTDEQRRQHRISRFRPRADTGFGHRGCTFHVDEGAPYYGFTVTPTPDLDARTVLAGHNGRTTRVVAAAGFPAVEGTLGGSNISCFINVDVADGQSLEVQSLLNSTDAFTTEQLCEMTRQVAEAAMTTLLSRQ